MANLANHIFNFLRDSSDDLDKRISSIQSWLEESGIDEEIRKATTLRELYQRGNLDEIKKYAQQEHPETMTGSWYNLFQEHKEFGFSNETVQNHLCYFFPDNNGFLYDYINSGSVDPEYQSIVKRAQNIYKRSMEIRDVISETDIPRATRDSSLDNPEGRAKTRTQYLLEEHKRKDEIIPMLEEVEQLYTTVKKILQNVVDLYQNQN